jgi:HK97 family phage major capsid protein
VKWIKLKKDIGLNKAGLLEVEDDIATAYIAAALAEDGGTGPSQAIQAIGVDSMLKAVQGYTDGIAEIFAAQTAALIKKFSIGTIEAGPQQADKSKSLGDFINCIARSANINDLDGARAAQDRLRKDYASKFGIEKGMEEATGTLGGFWTTPVAFEKAILMEQAEDSAILPGVTNVPLSARAVEWPALNQYQAPTKGNSSMYGGVTVSRLGENTQRSRTQPVPAKVKLEANDLTAFTQFSRDLTQDDATGTLESMLTKLIGGAIGFRRDWEHIWGTGEGQSLGFMNSAALLTSTRTTTLIVTWSDVARMLGRLTPQARKRAVWVAHPFHLTTLLEMVDGAGRYIYIPNFPQNNRGSAQVGGVNNTDILANLPVIYSEKMAAPGTTGDFCLCDRSAILSGVRGGIEFGLSEHFLFDTDQIALRCKIRDDAQPWVVAPFILADGVGTNKVSPFGALSTL